MEHGKGQAEGNMRSGSALDDAYRRHFSELISFVRRNFGSGPPDPEDIAQQSFIRMSGADRPVENIGAFLRRTARNLVIDHHRGALRASNAMRSAEILEENNADFSPEDVLSSREELSALNEAIAMLRPNERVALLLRRIDDLTYGEIAERLGVSESGARLLVDRALEKCVKAQGKP